MAIKHHMLCTAPVYGYINRLVITTEQFIKEIVSLQPRLRVVADRMLRNHEEADDAVQDTLTKLWRMRWRLGMMKNAQGYAMRILQHVCLDKMRHSQVEQKALSEMSCQEESFNAGYERLAEAIALLPERQRKLIEMKYRDQMSSAEMAEAMGMSASNVNTAMSRAYATLRQILNDDNEEVRQ